MIPLRKIFVIKESFAYSSHIPEEAILDIPDSPLLDPVFEKGGEEELYAAITELESRGFTVGSDDVVYNPKHWRPLDPENQEDLKTGEHIKFDELSSGKVWYAGHGQAYLALTPQAREFSMENPPQDSLSIDMEDPEQAAGFERGAAEFAKIHQGRN
jgi:hypothetical protein